MENFIHNTYMYTVECKINITDILKIQIYTLMPMMRYLKEECELSDTDTAVNLSAFRTNVLGIQEKSKSEISENVLNLLGLVTETDVQMDSTDIITDIFVGTLALCTLSTTLRDEFLNGISYERFRTLMREYDVQHDKRLDLCKDYVLQLTRTFGDKLLDLSTVFAEYSHLKFTLDKILYVLEIGYARMGVDSELVMRIVTTHLLLHECDNFSNVCNIRFIQNKLELIWDNTRRVFCDDTTWHIVTLQDNSIIFKAINGG